ncbi:MAG: amidohydrolase family protein [Anaerovoracaceae bacterium]
MNLYLKNCHLIPALSGDWKEDMADIQIENGIIKGIFRSGGSRSAAEWFSSGETIDCDGKTVLPGLFDIHTHINWDYLYGMLNITDFRLMTRACQSAQRYLDCGITTIRDLGSAKRVALAVREAIEEGVIRGPRILAAGMIIAPVRRAGTIDEYHFLREVSGEDAMLRAAREEIGEGADYVKIYVNGNPPDMLAEEIRTAIETAHQLEKRVAAHAHYTRSIHLCLEEGVDTLEHGTFLDEACVELLKKGKSRLVPTLSVFSPGVLSPGDTPETKKLDAPMFAAAIESVKTAYRAGVKMGLGTDTPIEILCQPENTGLELRIRHELCGLPPVEVLLQATKFSAQAVGLENVTGEIREGLAADLIVVAGDPEKDFSVMYQKPELVVAGGEIHIPV